MATPTKANGTTFLSKVNKLDAGIQQNFTPRMSVSVAGAPMQEAAISAKLSAIAKLFTDAMDAKSALAQKVSARKAGLADAKSFVANLEETLKQLFGPKSPVLQSFGIALPKARTPRTAADKAISAARAAQTKGVRGTKGSRQKQDITVEGKPGLVVVSPTGEAMHLVPPIGPGGSGPVSVTVGGGSGSSSGSNGSGPASGTGNGQGSGTGH
ncbi:MAG: hypothetical protein ACYCWW_12810 [Deltaproteobacteria bacterium]